MQAFFLTMILNYMGSICFYKHNVVKNNTMVIYTALTMLQRRTILADEGVCLTQSGTDADRYIPTIVRPDIQVK
jgi:hypothetical protein